MSLVGGGLGPYRPRARGLLWWTGFALLLAFQVWGLPRWLSGGIELAQINAGWLIMLVGGIVAARAGARARPCGGLALHLRRLGGRRADPHGAALLPRDHRHAAAGALRPSWFILLVPPSLIYANGLALYPGTASWRCSSLRAWCSPSRSRGAGRFLRWPFSPAWWAFTFPLDALAYAAARYASDHPSALWQSIAAVTCARAASVVIALSVGARAARPDRALGRLTSVFVLPAAAARSGARG